VVSRKRKVRRPSTFARVFLDEPAFISVVVSAIEAYRRECYGVLLGSVRLGRAYIRTAIAYQTARRTPTSVDLTEARRRTLRQALLAFPRHDYIGEFHSHPDFGGTSGSTTVGDSDLVGVRWGEYELIIAVRYPRNKMPWHYCADGSLSGVAGGHMVKMRAYMAEPMKKGGMRGRPVGLKCHYAVKAASSRRLLEKRKQGSGP
jgi:proteasome lid subunit RPN8/RPN11